MPVSPAPFPDPFFLSRYTSEERNAVMDKMMNHFVRFSGALVAQDDPKGAAEALEAAAEIEAAITACRQAGTCGETTG